MADWYVRDTNGGHFSGLLRRTWLVGCSAYRVAPHSARAALLGEDSLHDGKVGRNASPDAAPSRPADSAAGGARDASTQPP
jgi:hypothetical protein